MSKRFSLFILLFLAGLVITGCSLTGKGADNDGSNGGLYKTISAGANWQQQVFIPTISGQPLLVNNLNVVSLKMDPSDRLGIYYGSLKNGLFYSYNGAKTWLPAKSLGQRPIGDIAINPQDKCTIYVVSRSKVFKTDDCSRTWSEIYSDNNPGVYYTGIAVDYYNSDNVYIVNTRGDIIKSFDKGKSWQTLHNFKGIIRQMVISPHDSRIIMVATANKGLWRSLNGGKNWTNLKASLKEFGGARSIRDLVASKKQAGLWFLATNYGLLESVNNGDAWTNVELIVPERKSRINDVAISDININKIYYVTNTTFYSSIDGGVNWISRQLPSRRRGWRLLVDPSNDNIVYLGVSQRP